jgi:Winged helix DNA-binding domain
MAEAPLTLRDLNRATLARQMLLGREKVTPLRAIERLMGLQAQWPKPPHIGLWSRIEGFKREGLLGLLRRREAVRAPMMRGTLHVVSAKDYLAMRQPLQPMLTRGALAVLRERARGIDVDEVTALARKLLADGPRTFEQVRDALASVHPKADHRAMAHIARLGVPLVQVPTDAEPWGFPTTPQFALAEGWLGAKLHPSEALDDLVLRFLAAFGPATAGDVQTWSGVQGVKEVVERLRPRLTVLQGERKRELFDAPKAPRPGSEVAAPALFLPEFDNLVLSHTDRRRFVADAHRKRVYLPGLRIAPTFLVDGFVAGTWTIERKRDAATLAVEPFEPLTKKARSELAAEGEGLLRFVEPDAGTFDLRFARPPVS